jgi:hypothetical protein
MMSPAWLLDILAALMLVVAAVRRSQAASRVKRDKSG